MDILIELLFFIFGIIILSYSGQKSVENAEKVALYLGVPTIIIGGFLVSIGTDIPEIANSIIASTMGHGDINVGDSIGSTLTQLTIVLGVLAFSIKNIKFKRREWIGLGGASIIAIFGALFVVVDGKITQLDGVFLILLFFILFFMVYKFLKIKEYNVKKKKGNLLMAVLLVIVYLMGVFIGAHLVVNSTINIAKFFSIPEFIISFFITSIGTSMPELTVDLIAMRNKKYGLAVGDLLGSNIVDPTLAMGFGPLIAPTILTSALIIPSIVYTLFVFFIIIGVSYFRGKIDRLTGILAFLLYIVAYLFLFST